MALLRAYNSNPKLISHALAVEATMRHFAARYNQDQHTWGIIGLVHDLDWERYPDEHCQKTEQILTEKNWDPQWIRAIKSHAWNIRTDVQPRHVMEKVLYTIDELTGLITAAAYVRPSKSVLDLELKSVKKKWKQPAFAAGVDRSVIETGAAMLELPLDNIITETIIAMRAIAADIGLKGTL